MRLASRAWPACCIFETYGSYIEDLKRGGTVVCANAEVDPRTGNRAAALEAISARLINMPIFEPDEVVALPYLDNAKAREWSTGAGAHP